jgi:hypothetical protein
MNKRYFDELHSLVARDLKEWPIPPREDLTQKLESMRREWTKDRQSDELRFYAHVAILFRDVNFYLAKHECEGENLFQEVIAETVGGLYLVKPDSVFFGTDRYTLSGLEGTLPDKIAEYSIEMEPEDTLGLLAGISLPGKLRGELAVVGKYLFEELNRKIRPLVCHAYSSMGSRGQDFLKELMVLILSQAFAPLGLWAPFVALVIAYAAQIGFESYCKEIEPMK